MKKILLLGGSKQQLIAIKRAKSMGYYTIVCDYLIDNPGQYIADKFYLISTTDKESVLNIARSENIDGILAYASDPAAPTAAYVSEKLNLPGNPYNSIDILCNKGKFRKFLKENGFNTPKSWILEEQHDIIDCNILSNLPLIVKPVDSSGSKGVTKVYNADTLELAVKKAFGFSRKKKVIIEQLIEKDHEYLIGGDILVYNGDIVLYGLLNCHRDPAVNDLVPVGKSYPLKICEERLNIVKLELQKLVKSLYINSCAMNIEIVIDKNNRVWFLDIGPRNGGNLIPELLSYIYDIDIVSTTIRFALGCDIIIDSDINTKNKFYASYNIHSNKKGILKSIEFSDDINSKIFYKNIYIKEGDVINYFDNASMALGVIFMKFENLNEQHKILNNMEDNIRIELE